MGYITQTSHKAGTVTRRQLLFSVITNMRSQGEQSRSNVSGAVFISSKANVRDLRQVDYLGSDRRKY